jgi:hypothetical protein
VTSSRDRQQRKAAGAFDASVERAYQFAARCLASAGSQSSGGSGAAGGLIIHTADGGSATFPFSGGGGGSSSSSAHLTVHQAAELTRLLNTALDAHWNERDWHVVIFTLANLFPGRPGFEESWGTR